MFECFIANSFALMECFLGDLALLLQLVLVLASMQHITSSKIYCVQEPLE